MAVLIVVNWTLGIWMTGLGTLQEKFVPYQWHKSIGITVFALAVLRLIWRQANPIPALPSELPKWERHAAAVGHSLLYVLLLLVPLAGFLMASASPYDLPTLWFGLPMPDPLGPSEQSEAFFKQLHEAGANLLALTVAIHVLAALKHHLVDRNGVLTRMIRGF